MASNAQGAPPLWVTSTTSPDTAPNDAFADDPGEISDKYLDTPGIAISSATAQVSFRNFYNTEPTFDGGVLEVLAQHRWWRLYRHHRCGGGRELCHWWIHRDDFDGFQSPIAGRVAWNGNSNTYVNTVANLPAERERAEIKLRFRMASDNSVSATGWRVDTVEVTGGACPSATPSHHRGANSRPPPPQRRAPLLEVRLQHRVARHWVKALTTSRRCRAGWVQTNHSTTIGTTNWFQGNSTVFPAQAGAPTPI